jgi:hypothetical protein
MTFLILGISSSQLTKSMNIQRGRLKPPTSYGSWIYLNLAEEVVGPAEETYPRLLDHENQ